MKRRAFIAGLGSAAALPLMARAQQGERVRRVGYLSGIGSENDQVHQSYLTAFREALANLGWVDGRNLRLDVRFGAADEGRIRALAAELVGSGPDVILSITSPATTAVQHRTQTIPIVFAAVGDPVENGIVKSIARPEGNVTGVTNWPSSNGQQVGRVAEGGSAPDSKNRACLWRTNWNRLHAFN
jgi:putative ABC transport system substrate-binding protein